MLYSGGSTAAKVPPHPTGAQKKHTIPDTFTSHGYVLKPALCRASGSMLFYCQGIYAEKDFTGGKYTFYI